MKPIIIIYSWKFLGIYHLASKRRKLISTKSLFNFATGLHVYKVDKLQ